VTCCLDDDFQEDFQLAAVLWWCRGGLLEAAAGALRAAEARAGRQLRVGLPLNLSGHTQRWCACLFTSWHPVRQSGSEPGCEGMECGAIGAVVADGAVAGDKGYEGIM
jgi:hypothetical protein